MIGDYPPKRYYVFRTPDKVAIWFCFVRNKRIYPVKLRNTTVFCRFLNAALRSVRFKEMEFQLNEIYSNMKYIRGIVQCSAFNGTITRYCRIDLVGMCVIVISQYVYGFHSLHGQEFTYCA